jgi:hypothetical protein
MKLLLPIADFVPYSPVREGGALDFIHFQDISVKVSRAFHVTDGNENMMDERSAHGMRRYGQWDSKWTRCVTQARLPLSC